MIQRSLKRKVRDASHRLMARSWGRTGKGIVALAGAGALGGCVQVTAPERPIEINLNINIRQEVVVRLQQDAQELIRNNEGIF
jgi:hypothetical protein